MNHAMNHGMSHPELTNSLLCTWMRSLQLQEGIFVMYPCLSFRTTDGLLSLHGLHKSVRTFVNRLWPLSRI